MQQIFFSDWLQKYAKKYNIEVSSYIFTETSVTPIKNDVPASP